MLSSCIRSAKSKCFPCQGRGSHSGSLRGQGWAGTCCALRCLSCPQEATVDSRATLLLKAPGAPPASRRPPRPRCGSVALPSVCVCRMALHSPGQSIKECGPHCLGPHSASRHCPEHSRGINPLNLHKPPLSSLSLSSFYRRGN